MSMFSKLFSRGKNDGGKGKPSNRDIYREWDRQRSRALSPSDRAEIDAIFSRSI